MATQRWRGLAPALHLAALWALAVAQPLFDLLGSQAEFFAVRGSTRWDIVAFAVGVVVVPPLVIALLETIAGRVHSGLGRAVHLVAVAALVALLALQAASKATELSSNLLVPLAVLAGTAVAIVYDRVTAVRTFFTVLAPIPLVFLGLFLFASPTGKLVLARDPEPREVAVASTTPVVLVVFDEIPTTSLLDETGGIDPVRYPNPPALAGESRDVRVRLRGDLRDFPFLDPAKGEFRVAVRVEKGSYEYLSGWPRVYDVDAELLFERDRLEILAHSATILGARASNVLVVPIAFSVEPVAS